MLPGRPRHAGVLVVTTPHQPAYYIDLDLRKIVVYVDRGRYVSVNGLLELQ
jgi:hypothetical protein